MAKDKTPQTKSTDAAEVTTTKDSTSKYPSTITLHRGTQKYEEYLDKIRMIPLTVQPKTGRKIPEMLRQISMEELPETLREDLLEYFPNIGSLTFLEGIMRMTLVKAFKQHAWAIDFFAERTEGKPVEIVDTEDVSEKQSFIDSLKSNAEEGLFSEFKDQTTQTIPSATILSNTPVSVTHNQNPVKG